MKMKIIFGTIVLIAYSLSTVNAEDLQQVTVNEVRQAQFAEDVIMIELAHALSPSIRTEREKCKFGCRGGLSALEIAIGSIGVNRNDAAADALVNLLGLHLDAGAAEDRSCQILVRGQSILRRLEQLQPNKIVEHCQTSFRRLKKRELSHVRDVKVEQICHSEPEIRSAQNEFIKAIKSKAMCDQ